MKTTLRFRIGERFIPLPTLFRFEKTPEGRIAMSTFDVTVQELTFTSRDWAGHAFGAFDRHGLDRVPHLSLYVCGEETVWKARRFARPDGMETVLIGEHWGELDLAETPYYMLISEKQRRAVEALAERHGYPAPKAC